MFCMIDVERHKETKERKRQEVLGEVLEALEATFEITNLEGEIPAAVRKEVRAKVGKLKGRSAWEVQMLLAVLYHQKLTKGEYKNKKGWTKLRFKPKHGAARPTFIQMVLEDLKKRDLPEKYRNLMNVEVPHVFVENDQDKDPDTHRRPEMPQAALKSLNSNTGLVVVKEKTAYARELVHLLSKTFPKAFEAVYIKRLGAPIIGDGFFPPEHQVRFQQLAVEDHEGIRKVLGCDGSGWIHPMHPIWEVLGIPYWYRGAIQVTIFDPLRGIFCKGILVCSDKAVDEGGHPIIVVDWDQVKGMGKAKAAKAKAAGSSVTLTDGLYIGIMSKWDKPGTQALSFQFWQQFLETAITKKLVSKCVRKSIKRFLKRGGVEGLIDRLVEENEQLALTKALCEYRRINLNPMKIGFFRNQVNERMDRWRYSLAQGADAKGMEYVVVHDANVPEGHIVIRPIDGDKPGDRRLYHGCKVVMTRSPIVQSHGIGVYRCINPNRRECREKGWLQHTLVKTPEGKEVPYGVVYVNPKCQIKKLFGDDDGDKNIVIDDPDFVEAVEKSLRPPAHGEGAVYSLEPPKDATGPKTNVDTWSGGPQGGPSAQALKIMGARTQGPVGMLATYQAFFLALVALDPKWDAYALALAGAEQEALDSEKHYVLIRCLNAMANLDNWVKGEDGIYALKPGMLADSSWTENLAEGKEYISAKKVIEWARILTGAEWKNIPIKDNRGNVVRWEQRLVGGYKLEEVLPYRTTPKEASKRLSLSQLKAKALGPAVGRTLVNHCLEETYRLWMELIGPEEIEDASTPGLQELLLDALEFNCDELKLDKVQYRALVKRSGLSAYGQAVHELQKSRNLDDNRHHRERMDRAILAAKAVLYGQLSALSVKELATIWMTELEGIDDPEIVAPDRRDGQINRAFRAVCFPGSPVLAELGISVTFSCTWAAVRMDEISAKIKAIADGPGVAGGLEAVEMWMKHDHQHHADEGIPLDECKHCCDLLRNNAVSKARFKGNLSPNQNKHVARVIGQANAMLGTLVKPQPPPAKK
jgi:hypothetical protein